MNHVVNTAMRIMSARYPSELVRTPLPPEYDLRLLQPIQISDQHHEIAKTIFNRRTTSAVDLTNDDIATDFESLDPDDQMAVIVAVFYMFGTKIAAMKQRTGIE